MFKHFIDSLRVLVNVFKHIHTHPSQVRPTLPRLPPILCAHFHFLVTHGIQIVLAIYPWVWGRPWECGYLPKITPLKRTDSLFLRVHWRSAAPQLGVGLVSPSPFMLDCRLPGSCAGRDAYRQPQVGTASSWRQLPCPVQKTMFCSQPSVNTRWSLKSRFFSFLLWKFLRESRGRLLSGSGGTMLSVQGKHEEELGSPPPTLKKQLDGGGEGLWS